MKKFNYIAKTLVLIFLSTFLITCQTIRQIPSTPENDYTELQLFPPESYIPQEFLWEPLTEEIEIFHFNNPDIPLKYHAVKIDLSSPNLELAVYPQPDTQVSSSYTKLRTRHFAKKYNTVIAVNATPFNNQGLSSFTFCGAHKTGDTSLGPYTPRYAALAFSDHKAYLVVSQTQEECSKYDVVIGGFFAVLINGNPQEFKIHSYDSRTAAGISEDGKTLYLLCVEGENKNESMGMSYQQSALLFKAMGAYNALQLDGGSSTDLCIMGESVLSNTLTKTQGNSFGFILK